MKRKHKTEERAGWMDRKKRRKGPAVWVWRHRANDAMGINRQFSLTVGSLADLPTEKHAWEASAGMRRAALAKDRGDNFLSLIERYKREALPPRHSSISGTLSRLRLHIEPRWGGLALHEIKPLAVEHWLKDLDYSSKTKSHLKGLMHRLFEFAMKCELFDVQRNPMDLVEVRGVRRRVRQKQIITPKQFQALLRAADLRMQAMMSLACCLGLRASEFLGLQWRDFDFKRRVFMLGRSVTGKHVEAPKTADSEDEVMLDSKLIALLLRWRRECPDSADQWLFPNPDTGRPFHADSLRVDHLHPLGRLIGIPNLGWHAFRHTYRTLIDDLGTPVGVQQRLMRHADVTTTMNTYGSAFEETKRRTQRQVAARLLPGGSLSVQ